MSLLKENKKYYPRNINESKNYIHSFWNNELLRNKLNQRIEKISDIKIKIINNKINLKLLDNDEDLNKVCNIFTEAYTENDIKTIFTSELIEVLLLPKGLLYGIYIEDNLIGGILINILNYQICNKEEVLAKINLYGLKKEYQRKKLSHDILNVLKKELKVFTNYGIFDSDIYLDTPILSVKKYLRPLNYPKLHLTNLIYEANDFQLNYNINKYKINPNDYQKYIREFKNDDLDKLFDIYNKQISKYNLSIKYEKNEFNDIIMNKNIKTFVILKDSNISDFFSFYTYNKKNKNNEVILCSELIFITDTNIDYTFRKVLNIISVTLYNYNVDLLILYDKFGLSDILEEVDGFYINTNNIKKYYFYNLGCPNLNNNEIGFI